MLQKCWLRGVGLCGDRRASRDPRHVHDTAVLGTSSSKRWLVVSREAVKRYAVAGPQASPDQPQVPSFRTILLEVDVLACLLLLDAFLSVTSDAKLLGPSSCPDCSASSELSCPVLSKISRCLPHSQWTRPCLYPGLMTLFLLLLPKGPREGVSNNKRSSTSRRFFSQKGTRHVLRPCRHPGHRGTALRGLLPLVAGGASAGMSGSP